MGDPKRIKKKYSFPRHPWQKTRIEEEKKLLEEYGLKSKREIWKMSSKMKNFSDLAKKLIAAKGPQAEKEKKQLLQKLSRLGFVDKNSPLDAVLGLNLKNFLERRIQTVLFRKGMAKTISQARQFITHEHIIVKGRKITSPSYLVSVDEESKINFVKSSSLSNAEHPERAVKEK